MKYRAEIDGLRALAVVPVILFHAGYSWFSGGFVGVDVFFVISGYLITTIIITEMAENRFTIVRFYERRARRILPALFFVMAACLPFAWLWLSPIDLKDFGQSLIATSTFSSNILFWLETDYFNSNANLKVLLHTWSLAVEEQYYIIFPIFLLLVWRFDKKWIICFLSLVFFISLALAHWGSQHMPSAAFYFLPARGWEIIVGVLIAFYLYHQPHLTNRTLNQLLSLLGLGLIVFSMVAFNTVTPYPSFYTLIPTLGTGLIIFCAVPKTWVHQLLSSKPLVAVGLISYSAYLWHQPLFAFAKYRLSGEVSDWLLLGLCLASIVMGWFSWKFIEKPFRDRKAISSKKVLIFSLSFLALFIIIGMVLHVNKGFDSRFSKEVITYQQMRKAGTTARNYDCHLTKGESEVTACIFGKKAGNLTFALIGDSQAGALHATLSKKFDQLGHAFILYAKDGCMPSIELEGSLDSHKNCPAFNLNVIEDIRSKNIKNVIIFSRFGYYFAIDGFKNSYGVKEPKNYYHYIQGSQQSVFNQESEKIKSIKAYIDILLNQGIQVHFIEPIPVTGWDMTKQKVASILYEHPIRAIDRKEFEAYSSRRFAPLKEYLLDREARVIDTADIFCDEKLCYGEKHGNLLYYDEKHPSTYAAELIVESLVSSLKE